MYSLEIKPEADKIFGKLSKKDKNQLIAIHKKIEYIRKNPYERYKFLRNPLQGFNRVHIDSHFVLLFKIKHHEKTITVYYYAHHDEAYKWRP